VLFDGERTRVDRNAENFDVRQEFGPGPTQWEGEQLGNDTENRDGRVPEVEKLIQTLFPKK
jgi:hypothetical protein